MVESGTKNTRELSVEGVDVPKDTELDKGVIVAAQSQGTNLLLTLSWSFQVLDGRVFFMGGEDGVLHKTLETYLLHKLILK